VPTSRLTTETAQSINDLFNANVRQIWGAGNWPDLTGWGEARFVGDLLTYPNDVSQTAYWTANNVTVTANNISNPADNRVTASRILETATTAEHNVTQVVTAFGATNYQASVYARPAGRNFIYLAVNDGTTTFSTFFNVQTGLVGTQANVQSANISQCANGFFLCTIMYETGANATTQTYKAGISTDGTTISYPGDITKGLYLWGNLIVQQNNVSPQQFNLPWDQTGEAEIDVMFQAWVDSPAMITYPRGQGFVVTKDGFQMISSAGGFMGTNGYVSYNTNPANPIYIYYRKTAPQFTGDTYSATATYSVDQQIYFTSSTGYGDFYKCLVATSAGQSPDTTAASWEVIPLYDVFLQYCTYQAYADWLISDGQMDKAQAAYGIAESKMNDQFDVIERQMNAISPLKMQSHLTSRPAY